MAHRGASADAPGNTIEAFDLAIAQGADLIETDVRSTADGVLILAHDAEIADKMVETTPYFELKKLHPDLMTVAVALHQFGDQIPFCWEVKTPNIEAALVNQVRDLIPARLWDLTEFTSFNFESAVACRQSAPTNPVGWLTERWDENAIEMVKDAGLSQVCPPANRILALPALVKVAQEKGIQVRVWQVTSPQLVPQLASTEVYGGTVDWPGKTRALLGIDLVRDAVLYQDELVRIIVPHDAHIAPEDGGHLIVQPLTPHTGIETCSRDLRHRLIDAIAASSSAILGLPHMQGGIVNVQDNGNWFYRDEHRNSPKQLHIHIYGRAPGAIDQLFGEALHFPSYAERHLAKRLPLISQDREFVRREITERMSLILS